MSTSVLRIALVAVWLLAFACQREVARPAPAEPGESLGPAPAGPQPPVRLGDPCASDRQCRGLGGRAFCAGEARGFSSGACALPCDPRCPAASVCWSGLCVPSCRVGEVGSCRPDTDCQIVVRSGGVGASLACLPGGARTAPRTPCQRKLVARGLTFRPTTYEARSPPDHPELVCDVRDPVLLASPVRGVDFAALGARPEPLLMDCQLAIALDGLAERLAARDIRRINHLGATNCRTIRRRDVLSMHARGLALDLHSLVDSRGRTFGVAADWGDAERGEVLRSLARQLHDEFVFNVVLTPDYNAGHRDHLHLDLSEGRHFLEPSERTFLLGDE